MPRNPVAEIERIMAEVAAKCQDLASRELSSPEDVRRLVLEAAAIGREWSDRVSEVAVVANVERLDNELTKPGEGTRSLGKRKTTFRLLSGREVTVRVQYRLPRRHQHRGRHRGVGRRGKAGRGIYPALARLGIMDGGRLRVRSGERRGRRRAKTRHRGYSAPGREPKGLTIYTIDDRGRRDRRELPLHDGTMKDADAVFALIVGHLRLLGAADAAVLVLVGDGARWIWDRNDPLVAAVGIARERFVAIVDYYHAVEHLQMVADLRANGSAAKRRDWMARTKKLLRAGRVERVIQAIDDLRVGRRAKAIQTERNYFVRNIERMRYLDFEHRGLPVGSGAVESAVRRIVNLRLKSNATYWLEPNAEAVLHLRAVLKAGRSRGTRPSRLRLRTQAGCMTRDSQPPTFRDCAPPLWCQGRNMIPHPLDISGFLQDTCRVASNFGSVIRVQKRCFGTQSVCILE